MTSASERESSTRSAASSAADQRRRLATMPRRSPNRRPRAQHVVAMLVFDAQRDVDLSGRESDKRPDRRSGTLPSRSETGFERFGADQGTDAESPSDAPTSGRPKHLERRRVGWSGSNYERLVVANRFPLASFSVPSTCGVPQSATGDGMGIQHGDGSTAKPNGVGSCTSSPGGSMTQRHKLASRASGNRATVNRSRSIMMRVGRIRSMVGPGLGFGEDSDVRRRPVGSFLGAQPAGERTGTTIELRRHVDRRHRSRCIRRGSR